MPCYLSLFYKAHMFGETVARPFLHDEYHVQEFQHFKLYSRQIMWISDAFLDILHLCKLFGEM